MSELRVTTIDNLNISGWKSLPNVVSAEGCVYLTAVVRIMEEGQPSLRGMIAFADRLTKAVESGYMTGKLAPVVFIPLADGKRGLLAAYMKSDKSREELNEFFGEELFFPEGGLGADLTFEE